MDAVEETEGVLDTQTYARFALVGWAEALEVWADMAQTMEALADAAHARAKAWEVWADAALALEALADAALAREKAPRDDGKQLPGRMGAQVGTGAQLAPQWVEAALALEALADAAHTGEAALGKAALGKAARAREAAHAWADAAQAWADAAQALEAQRKHYMRLFHFHMDIWRKITPQEWEKHEEAMQLMGEAAEAMGEATQAMGEAVAEAAQALEVWANDRIAWATTVDNTD